MKQEAQPRLGGEEKEGREREERTERGRGRDREKREREGKRRTEIGICIVSKCLLLNTVTEQGTE
jgi:hypothetical protein